MQFLPRLTAALAMTASVAIATPVIQSPAIPAVPVIVVDPDEGNDNQQREEERAFDEKKRAATYYNNTASHTRSRAGEITAQSIFRATRQLELRQDAVSAGVVTESESSVEPTCVWFCQPSVFAEYLFLNSDDSRRLGSSGDTHMFSGGLSFTTVWELAAGINYAYSNAALSNGRATTSTYVDSHFVSIYVAKTFLEFLYAGVTAGYGHSDVESRVRRPRFVEISDVETWTASPFLGGVYSRGSFTGNLTIAYSYTDSESSSRSPNTDSTDGKLINTLNLGYAITERFTATGIVKFTQMLHYPDAPEDFPEDRNWWTVGAKLTHRVTDHFELGAGYEYDINDNYDNHTVSGGLTCSF